jgi:hypothetical protein
VLGEALPPALGVVVVAFMVATDGGYFVTTWNPGALVLLGLLAVALVSARGGRRPPRPLAAAVLLLLAYAAWSYLSIAWSGQPGDAWDGANRTLLYALAFTLFAWRPLPAGTVTTLVGALAAVVVGIGLVELLHLLSAADPRADFIGGRLSEPVGYPNADAVLWTMGVLVCMGLACVRSLPSLVRGPLLGGAVLLGGLALMAQSRGWLFALPIGLLVFVALQPDPVRALGAVVVVALGVIAMRSPVLHVHESLGTGASFPHAVDAAARAVLLAAAVVTVIGVAIAEADRRLKLPWRGLTRSGRVVLACGAAIGLVAVAALTVVAADPRTDISRAWNEFTSGQKRETAASRFSSGLGSNRYDFWRVGMDAFWENPIGGLGADTFQHYYLRQRHSTEQPLYPHSLEVRALAETGLVGTLALGAALAAALIAGIGGGMRWRTRLGASAAGAAVAAASWWLIQGSLDWFWEFAGLGTLAFALLGLAAAARPPARDVAIRGAIARLPRRAAVALGAVAGLLAGLSFVMPWLAEREVRDAASVWRTDPQAAYDGLDRAAGLNPLAGRPRLVDGAIAFRLGQIPRAREAFRQAVEREPGNAYALLELGLAEALSGRREAALRHLRAASAADPLDGFAAAASKLVERGRRPDARAINALIAGRARNRLR